MLQLFSFIQLMSFLSLHAIVHQGVYEVPTSSQNTQSQFSYQIEIEVDKSSESNEFEILFPKQLVGHENRFTIKKVDGQWTGNPNLFRSMDCNTVTQDYDLQCDFEFNKNSVVLAPVDAQPTNNNTLFVNPNLAAQEMLMAGLSKAIVAERLISTDIFFNEPIGILKYKTNSQGLDYENLAPAEDK